jgi:hypothetical protein
LLVKLVTSKKMDAECTTEQNLMLEVSDVVGVFVGVRLVERDMLKLICTHTALCGWIGCSTLDFKCIITHICPCLCL